MNINIMCTCMQRKVHIFNENAQDFLSKIKINSIDLVLTDPPYMISKTETIRTRTESEWDEYVIKNNLDLNDDNLEIIKQNYLNFGNKYGKRFLGKQHFGEWDDNFTIEDMDYYIKEFYDKLKNGGTCIIFMDLWKIGQVKDLFEKYKFKQIRMIEWIKTNPQPRNSKLNYMSNCREIAILGVKKENPVFHSQYDNGIYYYPVVTNNRIHPTQKNDRLIEDLIKKHSNENDTVLDTFLGSGVVAKICKKLNRYCLGCEIDSNYFSNIQV